MNNPLRMQVRSRGERVITFEQFVSALAALAARANFSLSDVASQVLQCEGPVTRATEALPVRFYDDKARLILLR
jgi:p25-alpha